MTKKTVNVVKKHEVTINMDEVNQALIASINMIDGHTEDGLDPRDADQNHVSFADNPYLNQSSRHRQH